MMQPPFDTIMNQNVLELIYFSGVNVSNIKCNYYIE